MLLSALSSLILFIPAALEGIGITRNLSIFGWLYIVFPVLLYLYVLASQTKLRMPVQLTITTLAFFIFSTISTTIFAVDKQVSAERFLFFVSLFLIFVFSYNHKTLVKKTVIPVIFLLGGVFMIYSLLFPHALHEKQVVYPFYISHNHLGDYLGLVLMLIMAYTARGKRSFILILYFIFAFVFFVLSFSRSAYAAFFIATFLLFVRKYRQIPRRYLFICFAALSITLFSLSLVSGQEIPETSPLYPIRQAAVKNLKLFPRDIWSGRDNFYTQAIHSIGAKPFFGVGEGNFIKVSIGSNTKNQFTDSAHNIFLEMAVEEGIPAFLSFFLICTLILAHILKGKDMIGYGLLFLLLNFQTDYTYHIYFFVVFAVILAALSYEEKRTISVPTWLFGLASTFLLAVFFLASTSYILLKMNSPVSAVQWYPVNKQAYIAAIQKEKGKEISEVLIRNAFKVSPEDTGLILVAAQNNLDRGNKKEALSLYEKLYSANHFVTFWVIKKMYFLKLELYSRKDANKFLIEVSKNYREIAHPGNFKDEFTAFCIEQREEKCWETGWYEQ